MKKDISRQTVYLVGDSKLVSEFAEACHSAGFIVCGSVNPGRSVMKIPNFSMKKTVPKSVSFAMELTNDDPKIKKKNLQTLGSSMSSSKVILSSSVTVTVAEQATWIGDPERLVGISALPTLIKGNLFEVAPGLQTAYRTLSQTKEFLGRLGKEISVVQDRIGMVLPRILCMLVNEACFALTEQIASPQDLDTAMKLGTNYPYGPIEWGDRIGFGEVMIVLKALHDDLGEERYRISPLLKQLAGGKKWWGT